MNRRSLRLLLSALALAVAAGAASAQSGKDDKKLYRWVDKNGQVHYGDTIPAEYADQHRDVLNRQGVAVGREHGTLSPEEARAKEATDQAMREAARRKQRDRVLLQTYQSVSDIETLRDRRLELVDAQLKIQEQSLSSLRAKRAKLDQQASRFQPRSTQPDARPIPEGLAEDIRQADSDIATQEENLGKRREERERIRSRFEADIVRFKELKATNAQAG